MIFTDVFYFFFLLACILLYNNAKGQARYWVIIASGLAFYGYYATGFLALLVGETLAVYFLTQSGNKIAYYSALLLPLLALGYYKYSSFAYVNLASILGWASKDPFLYLALPLAISFFTFEFIHYTIEVWRGTISRKSIVSFMAYAFFFPSMAAGPIKRYNEFDEQVQNSPPASREDLVLGVIRIVGGLLKKLILADTFAYISSELSNPSWLVTSTHIQVWIAVISYALYVYFDFSGYTDIAIGSAMLFGLKIPENFDYPFFSRNIAEFWRKWHMSLYQWFMAYVFKPLSVSLRDYGAWGISLSILVVFGLSGLWHGSDWNFIVWGLYHGAALVIYFAYTRTLKPSVSKFGWYKSSAFNAVAIGFNFLVVCFSFAFFASPLSIALVAVKKLLWLG